MPANTSPSALKRQLTAERPRCIYALWHRAEPPSRIVVEKFGRKLNNYRSQLTQRGFETEPEQAGSWNDRPDVKKDEPAAVAYVRAALADVDDVVVFYSDLLGDETDPISQLAGRELEFVCDPLLQPQMRYWFGRVHAIDTDGGQIGKCALNAVAWTFLPKSGAKFSFKDPHGELDDQVEDAITSLRGKAPAPPVPPVPPVPTAPAPAAASEPPATGWLQRLFGRRS